MAARRKSKAKRRPARERGGATFACPKCHSVSRVTRTKILPITVQCCGIDLCNDVGVPSPPMIRTKLVRHPVGRSKILKPRDCSNRSAICANYFASTCRISLDHHRKSLDPNKAFLDLHGVHDAVKPSGSRPRCAGHRALSTFSIRVAAPLPPGGRCLLHSHPAGR